MRSLGLRFVRALSLDLIWALDFEEFAGVMQSDPEIRAMRDGETRVGGHRASARVRYELWTRGERRCEMPEIRNGVKRVVKMITKTVKREGRNKTRGKK